jgi:replication initiation protein RepC
MERLTMTPFGRQMVSAGQIAAQIAPRPTTLPAFPKWELFRNLTAARKTFGLSDRDLAVLNGLLSFYPKDELTADAGLIVFPSNASLSERVHGMAESTLRRHLAALVKSGMIQRHDSPNGKRYARRDSDGSIARAFGFDLSPLLHRAHDITEAARTARAALEQLKRLREDCVLLARDGVKLLLWLRETQGLALDAQDDLLRLAQRTLRRKPRLDDLTELRGALQSCLESLQAHLQPAETAETKAADRAETEELSGKDAENERHLQKSNTESFDLESSEKQIQNRPALPLPLVLKACPDLNTYRPDPISNWLELVETADFVKGMLGITTDAWQQAVSVMGATEASIALACILQRADTIKSPGGYLRCLTRKAQDGKFSAATMVLSQLTAVNTRAA